MGGVEGFFRGVAQIGTVAPSYLTLELEQLEHLLTVAALNGRSLWPVTIRDNNRTDTLPVLPGTW